jgi:hypothetical protein
MWLGGMVAGGAGNALCNPVKDQRSSIMDTTFYGLCHLKIV